MSDAMWCVSASRRAISLIELLIALVIIGVLLAIGIPAILASREAARKATCANQLRQIGVALQSFESTHGHFPVTVDETGKDVENWVISILPHMGQVPLREQIRKIQGDFVLGQGLPGWMRIESQLLDLLLPGFHCPSDPVNHTGTLSYPGNDGIWPVQFGHNGMFRVDHNTSVGFGEGPVYARDVTDGLSNTMLASEWLHGPTQRVLGDRDVSGFSDWRRWVWRLPINVGAGAQVETVIEACRQVPPTQPLRYGWRHHSALGSGWFGGACGFSTYNHAMTPNMASCRLLSSFGFDGGLYTAGSYHRGGVNSLYADGRVAFIADAIDQTAWHELGSRSPGSDFEFFNP